MHQSAKIESARPAQINFKSKIAIAVLLCASPSPWLWPALWRPWPAAWWPKALYWLDPMFLFALLWFALFIYAVGAIPAPKWRRLLLLPFAIVALWPEAVTLYIELAWRLAALRAH